MFQQRSTLPNAAHKLTFDLFLTNTILYYSEDQPFVYKDAIFIATHKFVGGVQTPGILIAKKKLFRNRVPSESGGGSVFFVSWL